MFDINTIFLLNDPPKMVHRSTVNEEYESLSCFDGLGNAAQKAVENQVFHKEQLSEAEEFVKQVWEELKHGKNHL